jgi:hypothetical protein
VNQYDNTVRQLMPSETSANPYDDAVRRVAGAQRAQITGAELEVEGIAPDQFARGRQLADETGMPPMVAARELPTIEAERERERFRQLTGGSPTLVRWLAKPENMGIAKDDVEQLSHLEGIWQGFKNAVSTGTSVPRSLAQGAVEDFGGRALTGAGELLEIAQRRTSPTGQTLNEQLQDFVALVNPEVRALQTADPTLYAQYREKVRDWSAPESWLRTGGGGLAAAGQAVGVPQDQQGLPEAIGRGLGQVAGQLASAPLGLTVQGVALASQGASIQAERVEEAGATGTIGGDAAVVAGAAVTGITERLGLDFLMRKLPPGVQGALRKRLTDTLLSGAGEATQEVVEGLGQDLVEYQFYNPDVDFAEGWEGDATVGGAVGILVRALTHARARAVETRDSIEDAKRIETITDAAAASKVGKRYPQALEDFIRQARADGQPIPDAVYLDAAAVGRYFFQQGQDPAAEMTRLAGDTEAAAEAGVTGDLRVSMERWAAYVAQRPDAAELNRHARLDPERMTAAEAESLDVDDLLAQIYGGTEAAAARAESSAQEQDAAERVRADLIGQLTAAGVDRSAAELQAQVLSSRYQTRAERRGLGESAWDVYALSGLAIDRETPAVRRLRSQVEQFDTTIDPLIDAVRTGKMPDDRAVFGASLVSALVRAGGLRDTGGDLRSRGALRLRPGLVSQNGMGLDDALTWARERGYVSPDENAVDEQAFFDLIDAELSGGNPTYSDELINQRMAGFRAAVEDLAQELGRLGVDPETATNEQVKQALGLQGEGGRAFDQAQGAPVADQTQTPEFRRWFGDSQVVDSDGRPLVVYHGNANGKSFMAVMPDAVARAVSEGRDGLIVRSVIDHASPASEYPADVFVAFRPEQIKSATGNRGTFDPADPRILYQRPEPTKDQTQTPEFRRWFGDSKVVDAEGRPLNWGGFYIKSRRPIASPDDMRRLLSAYEAGAAGKAVPESIFADDMSPVGWISDIRNSRAADAFNEAGRKGLPEPSMVVGVRLGATPETGFSRNARDDTSEDGVSVLGILGLDGSMNEETDQFSAMFMRDRPTHYVAGFLHPTKRGSDGEPLLIFGADVGKADSGNVKSATGNRGTFDPADPRIQYQRPEPTKVERGRIEFRTDGGARIVLTESANLSTFLHETGHLWLEELITDATTAGTAPELAADLDRVLAWMGVDVRASDGAAAVRAAVQTDQHEQWARGFEAYLREGKAPSSALRQAFSRFRAWLLRLYRDVRALRVELSDDVRGVMDRLIATDAEIDEAQAANGYEAFADPEQARALGMTDAEWQDYARLMDAATREAREDVEQSLMRAWSREQQDYYRQERARMRETVEGEVNERPVYRAMLSLFSPDGIKLDKADLVERYGDAFLARLPGPGADRRNRGSYIYTLQGGTGLDQAAFLLGFDSGDALVQALVNAESRRDVIEAETDARMRDFYPDPMTDGAMAEKAQRAVHNGGRIEVIERELQVIARAAGQRAQQARVIRALAERIIGRQKIRALRPRDYLVAERKAAREAVEAIAAGQFDIAYRAKYRQALNARLYALASEASDNVEGARKYLRKFETTEKRQRLGKAGGTWLDQVDALIDAHDLKRVSNAELDRVAALRELDAAAASGLITVPPELRARLEDSRRTNWRELTVDELLALRDTVRNIDSVAMRELEMIIDGQVRDLDADADAVAASILSANEEVPANLGSKSRNELLAKWGRDALAIWNRPSDAVRNIEGEGRGPLMQRTIEVVRRAVSSMLEPMKAKAREDLAELYQKHYSRAELVKMAKYRTRVPGVNQDWTRFDLLALALNWGNADNRAAVLDSTANGRKMFNEVGVNQALQTLDARDWKFVQDVWDYVDSFWPQVSAAQKRRTGLAPKKVEAAPIAVQTRDGQTVDVTGGYYPLSYDPGSSPATAQSELEDIFNRVKAGGFSRAATSRGHTIERVGSGGRPVRMDINVLHSHVDQVIHDLALGDAVEYVWKVLNHGTVKAAFSSVGKLESHKWLNLWLKDAAAGEMGARSSLDSAFRWIRVGFTKSRLGFNIVTAALQPTGFLQSAVVVGKANMIRGMTSFMSSPREAYRQVMERSDFMRTRYELSAWNKDVQDTLTALRGKHGIIPSWVGPAMFYMMQKTQVVVDVSTWLGAYNRGLQDYNGDDAAAATYADGVVEQAQTSGFFSDRSAIERGTLSETTRQAEFVRSWTALISYMLAKGNIAYTRTKQTDFRSIPQVVNLAGDMVMLFTLEALLVALIRGAWPGEDDSWLLWLGSESAYSVLGGIPFVRELSSAAKGFSVTGTPQAGFLNDIGKAGAQLRQGEIDASLLKSLNNVGGTLFHYPSSQMNRAIDAYWRENVEGEDVAPIEYVTGRRGPPE